PIPGNSPQPIAEISRLAAISQADQRLSCNVLSKIIRLVLAACFFQSIEIQLFKIMLLQYVHIVVAHARVHLPFNYKVARMRKRFKLFLEHGMMGWNEKEAIRMARTKTQKALRKAERSGTWSFAHERKTNVDYAAMSQHVR